MEFRWRRAAAAAIGAALAVLAQPAGAADKVTFGQVSPTATVWPGTVATKKGFFAANNVEMDVVSIGVSPGMQAVAAGSLDIMHNTCNTPISFYEGGGTNVRISMVSMSTHPALLIGKKGMKSAAELKGKVVGTSSIKSGSTILLRRLLKSRGLGDKDYDVVAGQGSAQIFNGLQAGALDAVWLVPPQSYVASSAGYPELGSFREVAPKFPFVCFVTSTEWLRTKQDVGRRFVKAWLERSPGCTIPPTAPRRRSFSPTRSRSQPTRRRRAMTISSSRTPIPSRATAGSIPARCARWSQSWWRARSSAPCRRATSANISTTPCSGPNEAKAVRPKAR
jgi:NitT/TauT family transport system substrate-binding protein